LSDVLSTTIVIPAQAGIVGNHFNAALATAPLDSRLRGNDEMKFFFSGMSSHV
jgi:hypothetical protein